MPRRKTKPKGITYFIGGFFVYFFGALYWLLKNLAKLFGFSLKQGHKQAKKIVKKSAEKKVRKSQPKMNARYNKLKEVKKIKGNSSKFESHLLEKESTIGIILGARGAGKSAIGMKLLENFKAKSKKKVYAMGFKKKDLPAWISVVNNIDEIANDSVVLIDEGGITFSSRKSMSNANQLLSDLLMIARHKNLSVLFITQNSSNLEINALRQADFLILKHSSLLQKDFERKIIKDIYKSVEKDFEGFGENKEITYVHSDKFKGFIANPLPSFWSSSVSKSFK
ncbi:hypothetical protein GF358_00180 [Candidatus Woesearchaeota archaeon]|nr:hypothetical protein [Candidatus Woesearchaeota archaeon]